MSRRIDEQEWFFALSLRERAADPHAVEKVAEWVDALGSTQATTRSDGEPAVLQVAAAVGGCKKGRIRNHLGNICAWRSR